MRRETTKRIIVQGRSLRYHQVGEGPIDCIVIGPANLFKHPAILAAGLEDTFTFHFVDAWERREEEKKVSSDKQPSLSWETITEEIEAIRSALGLDKVAVFGHSAAGGMAIEYGMRYPDNCLFILPVAFSPRWYNEQTHLTIKEVNSLSDLQKIQQAWLAKANHHDILLMHQKDEDQWWFFSSNLNEHDKAERKISPTSSLGRLLQQKSKEKEKITDTRILGEAQLFEGYQPNYLACHCMACLSQELILGNSDEDRQKTIQSLEKAYQSSTFSSAEKGFIGRFFTDRPKYWRDYRTAKPKITAFWEGYHPDTDKVMDYAINVLANYDFFQRMADIPPQLKICWILGMYDFSHPCYLLPDHLKTSAHLALKRNIDCFSMDSGHYPMLESEEKGSLSYPNKPNEIKEFAYILRRYARSNFPDLFENNKLNTPLQAKL